MNSRLPSGIADFIRRLPKTETHLHIEGALPYELLQRLDPEKFAAPPPFWSPDYRYESFARFEEILIEHAVQWFTSPERYHEAAAIVFQRHIEQNVRYVETSFHLGIVEFFHMSGRDIAAAIREAAPPGLEVRVFAGMLRNQMNDGMRDIIEDLPNWDEIDGVDLHGPELLPLEEWTPRVWRSCSEAGKVLKAHAGEFGPARNVREAIDILGVRRVQHGVRAVEDPRVLALARDNNVTFDVCPISNVKLGVVPSIGRHPIRRLLEAGVRCTISTDDPFSFGNSIEDEYAALARDLHFTGEELARVASNGFEVADLPPARKEAIFAEIEALLRKTG